MAIRLSEKELRHQARRTSIKEGIYDSSSISLGDRFIPAFAIAINASNSLVAILSSVTGFLGPLSQLHGSRLMKKYSRKKIVLKSFLWQSLMWLPLILTAVLFYLNVIPGILPFILLVSFSLFIISSNIGHPPWFSWMGDIVDGEYRGRWFSKRNLLTGFVSILLAIIASFLLDYFKGRNDFILGFIFLFSLAFILKLMSWNILKKQYEPKLKIKKEDYFSYWQFLKKLPETNFGKFVIFRGLLAFSISISSPLVAIYLLRYLEFSYLIYILIIMSGSLFSLIFLGIWGKIADKYGNFEVIVLSMAITPLVPLLWILSDSPIYLIIVPSTIGGIVWSGFILGSGNFVYDHVLPQKRGLVISYYNMVVGSGIFFGAGLGALLINFLRVDFIEPLFFIFLIGSLARMIIVYIFLPRVKEIRKTKKFGGIRSLKDILLHETKPTLIEETRQIMHIRRYI